MSNRHEKLQYLQLIRKNIGEEKFRLCAAAILSQDFANLLYWRKMKPNRQRILEMTNHSLDALNCSPVSYSLLENIQSSLQRKS
jgi:hypothetical protein